MRSPFPGMDPYLEDPVRWSDFHMTVIIAMRAALNSQLPPGYLAAADRYVWVQERGSGKRKPREPDFFVVGEKKTKRGKSEGAIAVASPRTVTLPWHDHKGKPYLKILDTQDRRVVTVVEFLSPANKTPGDDRDAYLTKREEYLASGVNLVEFNLLRKGRLPPFEPESMPQSHYYILVCRPDALPEADMWPFSVRDRFPDISIPLLGNDSVSFNLRPSMDRSFEGARYDREINYLRPPVPPLGAEDAAWARELLKKVLRS